MPNPSTQDGWTAQVQVPQEMVNEATAAMEQHIMPVTQGERAINPDYQAIMMGGQTDGTMPVPYGRWQFLSSGPDAMTPINVGPAPVTTGPMTLEEAQIRDRAILSPAAFEAMYGGPIQRMEPTATEIARQLANEAEVRSAVNQVTGAIPVNEMAARYRLMDRLEKKAMGNGPRHPSEFKIESWPGSSGRENQEPPF